MKCARSILVGDILQILLDLLVEDHRELNKSGNVFRISKMLEIWWWPSGTGGDVELGSTR